jgi:hypothetical protein
MTDIFKSELDHAIVIFDNFLVLSKTFQDSYDKLVKFITLCSERNVLLGMPKSKIGYPEAVFFGYKVTNSTYGLTQSRKDSINSLAFPTTLKQVQAFLGATIFFSNNTIDYSKYAAPINKMTTKDFSFKKETWDQDYEQAFEDFKAALMASIAVTFPDYSKTFILRTDASSVAWGAVLVQVADGGHYECIGLASGKWSDTARKWDIEKQEACAIFMALKNMEYTLRGKYFIIECDNKNMLWMAKNQSSIVVRWRVYIQGFPCCLRFLLAKYNSISDWLTRQFRLYFLNKHLDVDVETKGETSTLFNIQHTNTTYSTFCDSILNLLVHTNPPDDESISTLHTLKHLTLDEMFSSVHGGKKFHRGIKATKEAMDERYPGNAIPVRIIAELIDLCSTCHKVRLKLGYSCPSENRHLKFPTYRSSMGYDSFTFTPTDKFGNNNIIACTEHFSKFTSFMACGDHTAENAATALFLHFVRYGRFQQVIMDTGTEFRNETVMLLNKFLGQEHVHSLVEVPSSNGVEPTNKKIKMLLQCICHDERVRDRWSDPTVLMLVQHACNSQRHAETGMIPMEVKFGSSDFADTELPTHDIISSTAPKILQDLNNDIKTIREISRKFQLQLVEKRDNSNATLSTLNKYQAGDFVLFLKSKDGHAENKADSKFLGPLRVISHVKNVVKLRDLITDAIHEVHSDRLKYFFGSAEQAREAALRDNDQYDIDHFVTYKGDPLVRTSIIFYIKFRDGANHWRQWSKDLYDTVQYEDFCKSLPQLAPLVVLQREATILMRQINKTPIVEIQEGLTVFLDLRAIGAGWFSGLNLPNPDFSTYVIPLIYKNFQKKDRTTINCIIPALRIQWFGRNAVNHYFIKMWGTSSIFQPNMTLITSDMITTYSIIESLM